MSRNRTENPNIAADRIDILEEHEIFVFGSVWKIKPRKLLINN